MLITRTSTFSGITRSIDLPVTQDQLDDWQQGKLIQLAMPQLTADQREFIISGATPEEWNEAFEDTEEPNHDDPAF